LGSKSNTSGRWLSASKEEQLKNYKIILTFFPSKQKYEEKEERIIEEERTRT